VSKRKMVHFSDQTIQQRRKIIKKRRIRRKKSSSPLRPTEQYIKIISIIIIFCLMAISVFAVLNYIRQPKEDWTIMVYMAGDNSLSSYVDENLKSMMKIGSKDNLDIIALADKSGNQDSKLYYVMKNKLVELPLHNIYISGLNEVDTGNPQTLLTFVNYSMHTYPSKNIMLIMWGHGNGWQGLSEDKGGSQLTMNEFRNALRNIVKANNGNKLNIIGFDACAMATIEGFYEVAEYAKYLISSEKKEPDMGWPYEKIFKGLASGSPNSPKDVSKFVVSEYVEAYEKGTLPNQSFSVQMSAIETGKNNELYVAFQKFASRLSDISPSDREIIVNLRNNVESYENKDNIDLYDLGSEIQKSSIQDQMLKIATEELLAAIKNTVIKNRYWNNPQSNTQLINGKGLTIYFPTNGVDSQYQSTNLAQVCLWDDFLKN
jgi:hypothetical protein